MINLIPPSAKKGVIKEYWKRVATVWLFILSAVAVILSVFLLPTYMLYSNQLASLSESASISQNRISEFDLSAAELVETNKRAARILSNNQDTVFSELVNKLEGYAKDVELRAFDFSYIGPVGNIKISGVAKNRQSLASFKDKVVGDETFMKVDLPISNLIKDKDLPFVIDVSLATST